MSQLSSVCKMHFGKKYKQLCYEGKKSIVCFCTLVRVGALYHMGSGRSEEIYGQGTFLSCIRGVCMQRLCQNDCCSVQVLTFLLRKDASLA